VKPRKFKKICKVCKKIFLGNSPTAKYCQECKLTAVENIRHKQNLTYWEEKGKIRNKIGRNMVRILRNKGYEHEQMLEYCEQAKVINS